MAILRSKYSSTKVVIPGTNKLRSLLSKEKSATVNVADSLRSIRTGGTQGQPTAGTELPFQVWRPYEGVQLVINWIIPPIDPSEIVLKRRLGNWPQSIDDGVSVFQEESPFAVFSYSDRQIDPYVTYYYALFSKRSADGVWVTNRSYRGKAFALPTGYFETKMWDLLVPLYKQMDGEG